MEELSANALVQNINLLSESDDIEAVYPWHTLMILRQSEKLRKTSASAERIIDVPLTSIHYTLTVPLDLISDYKNQRSNEIQINCSKGQTIMVGTFNYLLSVLYITFRPKSTLWDLHPNISER